MSKSITRWLQAVSVQVSSATDHTLTHCSYLDCAGSSLRDLSGLCHIQLADEYMEEDYHHPTDGPGFDVSPLEAVDSMAC